MTDFVPHTDADRATMLRAIGVSSIDALFDEIPQQHRFPELDLPAGCSEDELFRAVSTLAANNKPVDKGMCFMGAGTYQHAIPAIVDDVLARSEFYTSYTPYQPELSQGMLQATFEYQTMICRLTGMEVTNASHYDGATALAESVLMALNILDRDSGEILFSGAVNPAMRSVVQTYLQGTRINISSPPATAAVDDVAAMVNEDTIAVVVQQPDFFGAFHDLEGLAESIHLANGLLIVIVDPLSLGLFKPPADYGADIVVGDGQCLGIPPQFGGPGLGIMATRKQHARQMVGRLVGETVDEEGNRGYVLTLATREQHIRRARATSNICTNAALSALASAVFLSTLGKSGVKDLAHLCYQRSHYAAGHLGAIKGVTVNPWFQSQSYFREIVIELPVEARLVNRRLSEEFGIVGGYALQDNFPELANHVLLAFTDVNTKQHIDKLVEAISRVI